MGAGRIWGRGEARKFAYEVIPHIFKALRIICTDCPRVLITEE
jgi:hypothetical protein